MAIIYIQSNTTEQLGIIEENNEIKELVIDRPDIPNQVGTIYVAKVMKIEKGLQAAFVDIGEEKLGFLQRKELLEARKNPDLPIESIITEGQKLIVQVQKDAYGEKGARLTANSTVPGTSVIYLPFGNYIAVSKKIKEPMRETLKALMTSVLIGDEGAIVRTSAQDSAEELLISEYNLLRDVWNELALKSHSLTPPASLYKDRIIPDQLIRKNTPKLLDAIYVDTSTEANRIRLTFPHLADIVHWDKNWEERLPVSVHQLMRNVVVPRVKMPSGIELVIQPTEALTVIDVDSGGYTGKWSKEQTIVKANKQAAVEVAKQIRLRNISGIIVIDFIRMREEVHQQQIIKTLKTELRKDSSHTEVFGFTKLGLLEMTRKRESYTLPYILLDQEKSSQFEFSVATYAFMLERELLSYQNNQVEALYVEVAPLVYKEFKSKISLKDLKTKLPKEIYIKQHKGVLSYQIKLTGSEQMIQEYIKGNARDSIDKLF